MEVVGQVEQSDPSAAIRNGADIECILSTFSVLPEEPEVKSVGLMPASFTRGGGPRRFLHRSISLETDLSEFRSIINSYTGAHRASFLLAATAHTGDKG